MSDLQKYLEGGDLRSIGGVEDLVKRIQSQHDFDRLFAYMHSDDRLVAMRAADAVEKVSKKKPALMARHKKALLGFLETAKDKEFKWHLAQLVVRVNLDKEELAEVWSKMRNWAMDKKESRIVRVNALQALHDLSRDHEYLERDLYSVFGFLEKENIPSISARIRKLR